MIDVRGDFPALPFFLSVEDGKDFFAQATKVSTEAEGERGRLLVSRQAERGK
jgi:hypothetical protein